MTSPAVAAKIAAVIIQPSMLIDRPFTRLPMMAGLFVIRIINSMRGGVEKRCTIAATARAFNRHYHRERRSGTSTRLVRNAPLCVAAFLASKC